MSLDKPPKNAKAINKVLKLLSVSTVGALEKKLYEVPKGQAIVLRDKSYTKVDCGSFTVLVPRSKKG